MELKVLKYSNKSLSARALQTRESVPLAPHTISGISFAITVVSDVVSAMGIGMLLLLVAVGATVGAVVGALVGAIVGADVGAAVPSSPSSAIVDTI